MRWKAPTSESETGTQPAGPPGRERSPFSQKAFIEHLTNFIVADDQVDKYALIIASLNLLCSL
jgi:hypothetical protein